MFIVKRTNIHTYNNKQNKTIKMQRDSQKPMRRHNIQMYQILDGFSSDTTLPLLQRKTLEKNGGGVFLEIIGKLLHFHSLLDIHIILINNTTNNQDHISSCPVSDAIMLSVVVIGENCRRTEESPRLCLFCLSQVWPPFILPTTASIPPTQPTNYNFI